MRYRHRRADDAATRMRLKELAAERRRFGWRRLKLLLEREGIRMNHKKLRRLYAEERLQVRRRGGRKRALGTRAPMTLPQGPNQRWSLDFVADTLTDGRRFRILVVVDDFTRECLCLVADTSLSGHAVARELTAIIAPPRCASAALRQRQRHRADQHGDPDLVPGQQGGLALHRAGQAAAECVRRKLHRPAARRVSERDAVHLAARRHASCWRPGSATTTRSGRTRRMMVRRRPRSGCRRARLRQARCAPASPVACGQA